MVSVGDSAALRSSAASGRTARRWPARLEPSSTRREYSCHERDRHPHRPRRRRAPGASAPRTSRRLNTCRPGRTRSRRLTRARGRRWQRPRRRRRCRAASVVTIPVPENCVSRSPGAATAPEGIAGSAPAASAAIAQRRAREEETTILHGRPPVVNWRPRRGRSGVRTRGPHPSRAHWDRSASWRWTLPRRGRRLMPP